MAAEQSTSITIGANAQPYVDALKQAQTATTNFNTSLDKLTASNTQTTSQVTVTAQSFAKLASSLDPAARSAEQFAAAELKINAAVAAGLTSQDQANRLLDLANEKYKTLANQVQVTAKAQADAQKQQVAQAQQSYNQLQASINPVVKQQQDQAKVQETLNNAMNAGKVSAIGAIGTMQQWQAAQKVAGDEGKNLSGVTKLTTQDMIILEAQVRQFADQVLAGGGIFRPLAQQLPQTIDSMHGLNNVLGLLKNNLGLIAGIGGVAVVIGALVALGVSAESNQRSINTLANGLQKFGGDFQGNANLINDAAKTMAATTVLGTQEARDAMAQLASAPGFAMTKANLIATTNAVKDMAAGMGISTQQAAQFVTKIFADPVASAMQGVQDHIKGFDTNFVAAVQDMVRQGKQADAINTVFNQWSVSMKGAGDNVTPLQTALRNLSEAFTAVGNSATGAGKSLGTGLTDALAGVINDVTSCVKFLGQMSAAFTQMGVSGKAQLEIVGGLLTLQILPGVRNVEAALVKLAAVQFAGLIGGLNGVNAAVNTITTTMARNPVLLTMIAAMTAYQAISSHDSTDIEATAAQLGYKKQQTSPGGYFTSPTFAYTDPSGKSISSADMTARIGAFGAAPIVAQPPAAGAASDLISTVQQFGGKTGADLNSWLNANGAEIDAAKNAWCAAFVNSALASVGIKGTGSNLASSFLNFSEERPTAKAQAGDIIVQPPQAKGTSGHVGVYTGRSKIDANGQLYLEMTSGNEGGQVATTWVSSGNISSVRALPGSTSNAVPTAPAVAGPAFGPQTADQALQTFLGQQPTPGATLAETQRQLEQLKTTADQMIASGNYSGDALDKLKQKALDLSKAIYTTVDPLTQLTRAQGSQLAVENELNPAEQKVIEAQQAYTEQMRTQMGVEPTLAQLEKVRVGVLDQLSAGYRSQLNAGQQAVASENRIADAWENGAVAATHQMNAEKARQEIVGNSPTIDAAAAAAIEKRTKQLDDQTAASQRAALAQQKLQDESQLRLLDVQQNTAGMSAQAQATIQAAAQQAEKLKLQDPLVDLNSAAAQASIADAKRIAERQLEVARAKDAWSQISQAGSQAIDDMGQGLNSFLSTGKWSDFADAAKKALNDINQMFIQLLLLNPLKNLLLPGSNQPTLFSLFNNTGGATTGNLSGNLPGTTNNEFGGGSFNPGGLLGGLAGAFSKTGLFGSEGALFGAGGLFSSGLASSSSLVAAEAFQNSVPLVGSVGSSVLPVVSSALPAIGAHTGGIIGGLGGTEHFMPMSVFSHAPRLHSGGVTPMSSLPVFGNDEVPAVLQRGEMVLTKAQQRTISAKLNGNNRPIVITPTINVNTPDADSFRKSKNQVTADLTRSLSTAARKM